MSVALLRLAALLLLAAASTASLLEDAPRLRGASVAPQKAASTTASAGETLPDIQADGVEAVKRWAADRIAVAEQDFSAAGGAHVPSPATWAGVVIYHLMPDRFNNGDPSNDDKNVPKEQRDAMANGDLSGGGALWQGLPSWRHGGDIQGIRDRMGYFQDLGVQALWITPMLMHSGGYHGYCTTDLTAVDPGFGTAAELRALVAEAHEHNISVVMDVVINHLCDVDTRYVGTPDHEVCSAAMNEAYWTGQQPGANEAGAAGLNFSSAFFPPFRTEAFFNRCGPNSVLDTSGNTPAAIFGDFVNGMFDYNTQNSDFQEIFTNLLKYWIAFLDVDGFRLDAAKHVTDDFLAYFSTEMRTYAGELGKTNFLVVGEEASKIETWKAMSLGHMMSDPQNPLVHGEVPKRLTQRLEELRSTYLADPIFPAPGLGSLYNFNVSETSRFALRCDEPSTQIKDYFGSETQRTLLAQSVPQPGAEADAHLWTAIEIHDWPRFLNLHPERLDLLLTGIAWLLTAPGAPILYAGMEQGFNGRCPEQISVDNEAQRDAVQKVCDSYAMEDYGSHPDALKRQDMFAHGPFRLGSAVPAVNSTAFVGPFASEAALSRQGAWQTDEMLPRDHELYRFVRTLVAFRRSCPVLSRGATAFHAASFENCGLIAFSRFLSVASEDEVVVIINPGGVDGSGEVRLTELALKGEVGRTDGKRYVDALDHSRTASLRLNASGEPSLIFDGESGHLTRGAVRLFMPEGTYQPFDAALGISLCNHD